MDRPEVASFRDKQRRSTLFEGELRQLGVMERRLESEDIQTLAVRAVGGP